MKKITLTWKKGFISCWSMLSLTYTSHTTEATVRRLDNVLWIIKVGSFGEKFHFHCKLMTNIAPSHRGQLNYFFIQRTSAWWRSTSDVLTCTFVLVKNIFFLPSYSLCLLSSPLKVSITLALCVFHSITTPPQFEELSCVCLILSFLPLSLYLLSPHITWLTKAIETPINLQN